MKKFFPKNPILAPKQVIATHYTIYFGVFGIFLPYFNLYCYHIGFSGFQIGVLSGLRSILLVVFAIIWGALADKFRIRRPIFIACNIFSASIWSLFLFTADFKLMLIITFFYGIFYSPIISFLEAFTMDLLGKKKKSYGRIRAWGSTSFILIVFFMGRMIDLYSVKIILTLILIGSIIQAIASFAIPRTHASLEKPASSEAGTLFSKKVVVFLICAFLMLVSHGTYYGFFSIHLENLGYDNTFIGISWAAASIAEILIMINSGRIFKKFRLETVMIFSFITAALRWIILFFVASKTAILFSQALHAVSYGAFHMASILYIDSLMPENAKTRGQAINNAVTYGLGLMIGFLLNGFLYEYWGVKYLFAASCAIALLAGAIFYMFSTKRKTTKL